jgi:hypothetical protein
VFLNGDAQVSSAGELVLTPAAEGSAGSAWSAVTRASLALGFDTTFAFRLDGEADGIAFVVQSDSLNALGSGGSDMGYAGIVRALAVEIDTFCFQDEFGCDHVSVQTSGPNSVTSEDSGSIGHATLPLDVNDSQPHTLRVVYRQSVLTIYFDGSSVPLMTLGVNLADIMGGSIGDVDGCAFIGFTGATGGAFAQQSVIDWTFSSEPGEQPIACGAMFDLAPIDSPLAFAAVGSAVVDSGGIRLTDAVSGESGAAWYRLGRGAVRGGFETTFAFVLDGTADGIAFVIQDESLSALGGGGSGQGYASNGGAGITRSLAVEIDTFSFGPPGEFAADHVSIQTRGVDENSAQDSDSLGHAVLPVDVNDAQPHTLRVVYTPGLLDVYFDGSLTPVLSAKVDLDNLPGGSILSADGCAYIGFTGATGAVAAEQRITSWSFASGELPCVPANVVGFFYPGSVSAPGPLTISVEATGTPPLMYVWRRDGEQLFDGGNISGAATAVLTVDPVNTNWSGEYSVAVSNGCATSSTGAFIDVRPLCPGDANGDSVVSFGDITSVLANFGNGYGDGTGAGDASADGVVNFGDITTVLANFGNTCS